jgi:hypothetical protein
VDRFIEHLLRIGPQAIAAGIPGFNAAMLEQVRRSVVIIGDNVSNYYYEGNEQEDWALEEDFPNVAPPFDLFFLDFKAPSFIKSSVTGHHPWRKGMPIAWGLLCQGQEQGRPPIDLSQQSHRTYIQTEYQQHLPELQRQCALFGYDEHTVPGDEIPQRFTVEQQDSISFLKRLQVGYQLIQQEDWEELERHIYRYEGYCPGAKWLLSVSLFVEHDFSHQKRGRVAIIPAWQWDIAVNAQGAIMATEDLRSGPLALENLLQRIEPHANLEEAIESYAGGYYQFLCTGLLTLSFLHCKNVDMKTIEEPGSAERSTPSHRKARKKPRQKQTALRDQHAIPPRPTITYHVLDVEPMKQVLRTEGQVEHQGLKRAMHICRGHFAHYEEGKGLFGKYHGTYWREQHVRGSVEQGARIKDYRIKHIPPPQ